MVSILYPPLHPPDENFRYIRSFHSSCPLYGVLPQCGTSIFPLHTNLNPLGCVERGPPLWGCAGREAGVGTMRDDNVLPLDV
ncbi:uncharacterized protein BT62DRAFT_44257 [Guyanagaster necrorhizus]|uniref:Uncharacterized protein n=1 Tax=Guyanagaster necrorhizus TaxID=856835 RepID=A0A9P8B0F9_9AGAR|nr:uncharacterized protein BT62DRAFT_44257 [Guyanagaster necrorhizus MCA 3950]KAG7453052.1 hypothetical protein BT62DRAFT_44257 [Guyanagaster necrorhizus MCA 3950]